MERAESFSYCVVGSENEVHPLRQFRLVAICLITAAVALPHGLAKGNAAQAQVHKRVPKAPPTKVPPRPKAEERAPFTAEDQAAAVIPGIADARAWGDSESDFARLLPP